MHQRTCAVGSRARGVRGSIMGGGCNRDGATGRARSQQVLSAAGARGHHHTTTQLPSPSRDFTLPTVENTAPTFVWLL